MLVLSGEVTAVHSEMKERKHTVRKSAQFVHFKDWGGGGEPHLLPSKTSFWKKDNGGGISEKKTG
jgi:hypothetical protein